MELSTSLLAKNYGISQITSVATQISDTTKLLASQSKFIQELIAPSTMMGDLQSLALTTHQAINKNKNVSRWELDIIDSASYLVDRQVTWASQLYNLEYKQQSLSSFLGTENIVPKINVISQLSLELGKEKIHDRAPKEVLQDTPLYRLSEKGKKLINKVVNINRICERKGGDCIFRYTSATMVAAATVGGTYCSTKESLGEIIDCLYKIFYENLEHMKKYASDTVVRKDEVFQCIFRLKDIRTDYRHDYEHGSDSDIKKKNIKIRDCYYHYIGKPLPRLDKDFQEIQNKLYDEFDSLAEYLLSIVESYEVNL